MSIKSCLSDKTLAAIREDLERLLARREQIHAEIDTLRGFLDEPAPVRKPAAAHSRAAAKTVSTQNLGFQNGEFPGAVLRCVTRGATNQDIAKTMISKYDLKVPLQRLASRVSVAMLGLESQGLVKGSRRRDAANGRKRVHWRTV